MVESAEPKEDNMSPEQLQDFKERLEMAAYVAGWDERAAHLRSKREGVSSGPLLPQRIPAGGAVSIELTSEECEVLRRWGKDPDRIAAACHQRPNWLRDLLDIDEQMRQTRLSFLNEYQQEKSNG